MVDYKSGKLNFYPGSDNYSDDNIGEQLNSTELSFSKT